MEVSDAKKTIYRVHSKKKPVGFCCFFILSGIDKAVLKSLRYVFAFMTLIPVLLYTLADLIILCKYFKNIVK